LPPASTWQGFDAAGLAADQLDHARIARLFGEFRERGNRFHFVEPLQLVNLEEVVEGAAIFIQSFQHAAGGAHEV